MLSRVKNYLFTLIVTKNLYKHEEKLNSKVKLVQINITELKPTKINVKCTQLNWPGPLLSNTRVLLLKDSSYPNNRLHLFTWSLDVTSETKQEAINTGSEAALRPFAPGTQVSQVS